MSAEPIRGDRAELIEQVASLWRGDWSGTIFDGRTGKHWLLTALYGNDDELAELRRDLQATREEY